jgi:hypothetical protein
MGGRSAMESAGGLSRRGRAQQWKDGMSACNAFPYAGSTRIRFQGTLSACSKPAGTPNGERRTILQGLNEGKAARRPQDWSAAAEE